MERLRAWMIHCFTATGSLAGLMALVSILEGNPTRVLLWLIVAMAIDAADGPLARRFQTGKALPYVDGAILDHVIDYFTYTIIPAVFLYRFELLPGKWALIGSGAILMTSLYCFANRDLKTRDHFFTGFPAIWNLVVLAFFVLRTPYLLNAVTVIAGVLLTFVPIKVVHPFRVKKYRPFTIALTVLWGATTLYLLAVRDPSFVAPFRFPAARWVFWALSAYFMVLSLIRSFRGRL